jgi:hypothetical protein
VVGRAGLWLCFVRLRQLLSSVLVFKARFKPAASSESVADYLQRQLSYSRQNTCWFDLDVIRRNQYRAAMVTGVLLIYGAAAWKAVRAIICITTEEGHAVTSQRRRLAICGWIPRRQSTAITRC